MVQTACGRFLLVALSPAPTPLSLDAAEFVAVYLLLLLDTPMDSSYALVVSNPLAVLQPWVCQQCRSKSSSNALAVSSLLSVLQPCTCRCCRCICGTTAPAVRSLLTVFKLLMIQDQYIFFPVVQFEWATICNLFCRRCRCNSTAAVPAKQGKPHP